MKIFKLFGLLLTILVGLFFTPRDIGAQTITITGKINYSNWTLFAVNDTFVYTIHLLNPPTPDTRAGVYIYGTSSATLSSNGHVYTMASSYTQGFSTLNIPYGNVTGMNFNSSNSDTTLPIKSFFCDLYSYYPDNPSITDDQGMVLENVPLSQIITNGFDIIRDNSGGQYQFVLTGYTFAKGTQVPLTVSSPAEAGLGAAYTATLTGGTGTGAVTWALGAGSTAPGAAINSTTGAVTSTGTGTVVINATKAADAYNLAASSADFTVTVKLAATVTLSSLSPTYDGLPHAATVTTNPLSLAVNLTYNGSATAPTNAGTYAVVGTIADANYAGSATSSLVIGKANPVITWNSPAPIPEGASLGSGQLNATANVAGNFVYVPALGAVLTAGSHTLGVTFTPTDAANYNSAAASTSLVVEPAGTAPAFLTQPVNRVVTPGASVAFAATAGGNPAPNYQWQKNGVNIPGATSPNYVIAAAQLSDAGNYTVVAFNSAGSVTSNAATLTLAPNAISYDATNFPASAAAGTTINFTYNVTNTSMQGWGANHYLALRDANLTNLAFASLTGVTVGGSKTVNLTLVAPTTPGTYTYYVQGVESGVEFFSTKATLTLTVTALPKNAASYNSTNFPTNSVPGATINFTYGVTNTGSQAWGANHYLALRDSNLNNLAFAPLNGVSVGGSKTASLSLVAPSVPGTYTYYVQAVENGVEFFATKATLILTVAAPKNAASYGNTNFPTGATPGATITFTYNVTNTGSQAWGANHYLALRDSSQINLAFASLSGVAIGASKTASFTLAAPTVAGTYTYYIQGVEAGVEFFSTRATLTLTVTGAPKNAMNYNSTTFPATAISGATINFNYSVTNIGSQAWGANHYLALRDATQNNLAFASLNGVAVGGSKTSSFTLVAPTAAGTYTYYVQGVEAGVEFFSTRATLTLTVTGAPRNAMSYQTTTFPAKVTAGTLVHFSYHVTNTGTQAWGGQHYLSLRDGNGTYLEFVSISGVPVDGGTTVNMDFTAPSIAGTYTYYVQGVENGVEFFGTQATLTLVVPSTPLANAMLYNLNNFPFPATAGSTINFTCNVTNIGTQAWGAQHYVSLRNSAGTYLAFAPVNGVAVGASTTVNLSLVAPSIPGNYTYYIEGVENGVEFFSTTATLIAVVP